MTKNDAAPPSVIGEVNNVKVVVRCRPLTASEQKDGYFLAVQVNRGLKQISVVNSISKIDPPKTYTFDEVFDNSSDQIIIYNAVARPIVENVLKGYNGTILAYGQTGTGKTYTMSGNDEIPEERGIIPNSFAHIFDHIAKCKNDKTFLVRVSFLEIYNEDVHDLLLRPQKGEESPPPLEVKERGDIGVYVKDLSNVTVCSADHMFRLMQFGNANRHTGSTSMNERSSRSHALFTVTIECGETIAGRQHLTQGKLHLVDLAGSERQSKTNTVGDRLKEASKINLSLSNLGNVISALVDAKSTHIPYRNSKLTRLLQDSLGGNSKTVMIANIGPASYNYDETVSTLRYANRAKSIKNVSHINEDPKDTVLRKFQEEIEALRKQLESEDVDDVLLNGSDAEDNGTFLTQQQTARKVGLKTADQHFRERIAEIEREMAKQRERLAVEKGMVEAERRQLAEQLQRKETELEASKKEHDELMAKLTAIERKLIVGGENMLEKAEKQAQLLEESNLELERARQSEQEMHERLASGKAERLDIEEKYSTLHEEAIGKSKKLKKVWNHYAQAKAELKDVETEHQREMEALLENIRQLQKELALATAITDSFIPEEYARLIDRFVYWNEEIGDWQLRCIAYTGNNMRRNASDVASGTRNLSVGKPNVSDFNKILTEPQCKPVFTNYADVLGIAGASGLINSFSSTVSSVGSFSPYVGSERGNSSRPPKFRPRSAMKDRNAARIKALLD